MIVIKNKDYMKRKTKRWVKEMTIRILLGLIAATLAYLLGVSGYALEVLGTLILIGIFIVWSANRRD